VASHLELLPPSEWVLPNCLNASMARFKRPLPLLRTAAEEGCHSIRTEKGYLHK